LNHTFKTAQQKVAQYSTILLDNRIQKRCS